ncbi:MAG: hypothetical protein QXL74_08655 [Candidatus Bathyarchaeia archaeon]
MSRVRLRLSGALAFAANIIGYLTGFIFTILVTRRLSEGEFGVWALINSLIVYALTPHMLVGNWIMRDAARGKKVLESALTLYTFFVPISILIYTLAGIGAASAINYNFITIILFGLIVLIPYVFMHLGSVIQGGYMPQNIGISRILFELSKIIIAFFFVIVLGLRLTGALLSISLAYALQAGFLLYNSKYLTQRRINVKWVMKWIKGSPVNVIEVLDDILSATSIVLISVILGSAIAAGYWQAAISTSALVTSSRFLTTGLAARMISGGSQKDVDMAFSFSMMLAIPLLSGFLVLSGDLLWILKPTYSSAWFAASMLAISGIILLARNVCAIVLVGTDEFDQSEEVSLKDYFKSRIFLVNGLRTALTGLNLTFMGIYLFLARGRVGIIEALNMLSLINLLFACVRMLINLKLMKKMTGLKLNIAGLKPYFVASMIMAIAVFTLKSAVGTLPAKVLEAAPILFFFIVVGTLIYVGVLYLISNDFRVFLKEVQGFIKSYIPYY